MKDVDEQPDEEKHKGEVWEGLQHSTFCLPGENHPPGMDVFAKLEAL